VGRGVNGDLVGTLDGVPLVLFGSSSPHALLVDGKIVTTHMRAVLQHAQVTGALSFKPYDGTYYTGLLTDPACGCEGPQRL